jgi:hypothetical protein
MDPYRLVEGRRRELASTFQLVAGEHSLPFGDTGAGPRL